MPNNDYILRSDALKAVCENCSMHGDEGEPCSSRCEDYALVLKIPAADVEPKQKWTAVTDGLPKDNDPVNVVWINHDPESYYFDIKNKPFKASAVYFMGRWYWWSPTIEDILNEYGDIPQLRMDPGIEITHWSPIPEPPKEADNA